MEKLSKYKIFITVSLYLLVFIFPVAHTTDWGSDYSMYIKQAMNIVEGKSQLNTGYIANPYCNWISPPSYTIGFPLLLSVVYFFSGVDISAFVYLQTLFVCLIGFTLFLMIWWKHKKYWFALLGSLLFVFNPWVLSYRNYILSENSYIFFQCLSVVLYLFDHKKKYGILTGLLLGYALSIRSNAYTILLAIFLFESISVFVNFKKEFITSTLKYFLKVVITAMLFYGIMHKWIFPSGDNLQHFLSVYQEYFSFDKFVKNIGYYFGEFKWLLYGSLNHWGNLIIGIIFVGFVLIGLIIMKGREKIIPIIIVLQFIMVFLFPFQQGFRYVYPLLPFLIYTFINGAKFVFSRFYFKARIVVGIIILTLFGNTYFEGVKTVNIVSKIPHQSSPFTNESKELWGAIKENTKSDDIVMFCFPRIMALFGDRPSVGGICIYETDKTKEIISNNKVKYLATHSSIKPYSVSIDKYISENKESLHLVFKNNDCALYKIKEL